MFWIYFWKMLIIDYQPHDINMSFHFNWVKIIDQSDSIRITKKGHSTEKPTKWPVCPTRTQNSLDIRPVWSETLPSTWRNLGSLPTHWTHSEDSGQTARMRRLIWVFAGRTCHFIVLFASAPTHLTYLHFNVSTESTGVRKHQEVKQIKHTQSILCAKTNTRNRDCKFRTSLVTTQNVKMSRDMTKPTKMTVRPVKTQIRLGIPVWSESSLFAQWVAKDSSFLHADSENSEQTGRMPRLNWVLAGRTAILFVFSCRG